MHAKPSPRACLACRDKHLRCDGGDPLCGRCAELSRDCVYIQSRRGLRSASKRVGKPKITTIVEQPPLLRSSSTLSQRTASEESDFVQLYVPNKIGLPYSNERRSFIPCADHGCRNDDFLIKTYYQTVHPAHPFLFPYKLYQQDPWVFPEYLVSAMRYISSHHTSEDPEPYCKGANSVYQARVPDDGFKVQTLLLLTLTSYARFERELGHKALSMAIDVALKVGLNSNNFAQDQDQDHVLKESWRRTWWELFCISGTISLVSGLNYRLSPPHDMTLPTDDERYEICDVGKVGTTTDMQRRFFSEDTDSWSSFAYKIEAVRILNEVCECLAVSLTGDEVQALKASIHSFLLSIPVDKVEGLKKTGAVDEVMSLGLMAIHLANISLNLGMSELGSVRGLTTVCSNNGDKGKTSRGTRASRTACLDSAKALANLITSRTSLNTLSPCFSCAITFAAIVQLSECRLEPLSHPQYLQEQIKLQLSALKSLRNTWPIAGMVHGQLAQFCREVFTVPSATPSLNTIQPAIIEERWMQDLLAEDLQVPFGDFSIPEMILN